MSEVRVNNIVDYGGKGAPTFDNGAVISGVSSLGNQAKIGSNVTITSGGINVSGVTTAATLSGNLTGDVNAGFLTATSTVIGSGVTINAGGLNITGVMTATTFKGDGASLTGVAMTITPLAYNPDVNDSIVTRATGIGITFDHRIIAGSGNITLSIATNVGAAGTVVENFGVGSSVTIAGRSASIDPTSDLDGDKVYHINYPSGCFTNTSGDVSYVGTAYTFVSKPLAYSLWSWGRQYKGSLGQNQPDNAWYSSPVQIPGTNWGRVFPGATDGNSNMNVKTDGTLWSWGYNAYGKLGQNSTVSYSSPVQVGSETNWALGGIGNAGISLAINTDGELFGWGRNLYGMIGNNNTTTYSSPIQVPGTTWSSDYTKTATLSHSVASIKTDGTLWVWGSNAHGQLGINDVAQRSSPVQIPGTTWSAVSGTYQAILATKTDGTMWGWGYNYRGTLGLNSLAKISSPVQIPGTTWSTVGGTDQTVGGIKTDGTLWMWGLGGSGQLGDGSNTTRSSPVQVPGTTWKQLGGGAKAIQAVKTDGTLWTWGSGSYGSGVNDRSNYNSPVQVPGTSWAFAGGNGTDVFVNQEV